MCGYSPSILCMGQVSVSNSGDQALCVLVEPLGEDFWIGTSQSLTFTVPDAIPEVAWYQGGASVWVNIGDPYDFAVTTHTGEAVECGYQRPPGAFERPGNI
jgi:hypothetical protein